MVSGEVAWQDGFARKSTKMGFLEVWTARL